MPKRQSTAAKKARAAARAGAKYTAALRDKGHGLHIPHYLDVVDELTLPDNERMVVDCLRALAADGGPLPVVVAEPDPEVVEAWTRAAADGIEPQWRRWAAVEAAVDGYVLRETQYGPNGPTRYTSTNRGPRVPVPVRAADGTVTVYAMPGWARLHEGQWIWSHTGWPIETPGRIVDPPQTLCPSPALQWEVAAWLDLSWKEGQVLGEDYGGSASGWQTVGWCATRDDARQIARACTAYRDDFTRADVVQHGPDRGVTSVTTDTLLQAPDAPERRRLARVPGPRPASPDRSEVPAPAWHGPADEPGRPPSSLVVWTGTGWRTLVWTDWQTAHIAEALGIGAGGAYAWAEGWGPRHPDRDMHDWTQEGREIHHRLPETSYDERTQLINALRRAHEDALVDAVAARGNLTRDQAAARLEQGGEKYREVLKVGRAVISRALHTARRALPAGPERTAIRYALDDLMDRHVLPADAERIANAQLDSEVEAQRAPHVTAWCRRAVAEYVTPAADPVAAGVDGFGTSRR
ncbi:MAG: hypothetical protein HOV68_11350 [Streptomycetaceae bacterium]|nr:hypothetical protein [Streptomycetaceae bacterium]